MKESPILYSSNMVRAYLQGKKTMTRKVIKPQPPNDKWKDDYGYLHISDMIKHCPYGQVGDKLFITQEATYHKGASLEDRFWSRVYKFDCCWEWFGHTQYKKYGLIKKDGKDVQAHRLSWELHKGTIPVGKCVLHTCDIPWCVNPAHLYLGNNMDNTKDKISHGRVTRKFGEDNKASKLSKNDVVKIQTQASLRVKQGDIAQQFGVNQSEISRILSGLRRNGNTIICPPPLGHRTLTITGIRVERLQDITEEDAKAEGVPCMHIVKNPQALYPDVDGYRRGFCFEWDKINGKTHPWKNNEWVWVISYPTYL